MTAANVLDASMSFVARINDHDVPGIIALMTSGHVFTDGLGNTFKGRDKMRQGWTGYFQWFPDYSIEITQAFDHGSVVALFGKARGTFAVEGKLARDNFWEIPAAWRAVVEDGQIAEWQIYCDNDPVRKIMAANAPRKPGD
jgi:ketosteroid isomerase-like protein